MNQWISGVAERVIAGDAVSGEEANRLIGVTGSDIYALFLGATRIREHFLGTGVHLCAIINAKSGRCPENCAFCAQSAHYATAAPIYPLVDEERIVSEARVAQESGSTCYGIVTSGTTVKGKELEQICGALRRIRQETAIAPACSLGIITEDTALALKEAGMATYHHNLETARSFFPNICTTHDYDEDIATIRAVKRAGLRVCSGGIFGLGETPAQRVELAFTLRELAVESIPLNFLNPIPGTPLENASLITPLECLKAIALFRFINPGREISVCGGREKNLRDLQSWIFFAGASGTMTGNYLTTTGRAAEEDWQMLKDLELTVVTCCGGGA
jgi:biotin synthase